MYNFISINVKCPHCGQSLMDKEHKLDNESSIYMNLDLNKKKGNIRLSSVYGSFNYMSDFDVADKAVAEFLCPHCKGLLSTSTQCASCEAPIVDLILDMGGKVSFCSRRGCHQHAIQIEDLSLVLNKFYDAYAYRGKDNLHDAHHHIHHKTEVKKDEHNEIIETGTMLYLHCPHCKKSLIEDKKLKLKLVKQNGELGFIMLSPYLNVFTSMSTIQNPEDTMAGDLKCFHCDHSLMITDISCNTCKSTVARLSLSVRNKMVDFYICSKKGCKWHGLNEEQLEDIKLDDSMEW